MNSAIQTINNIDFSRTGDPRNRQCKPCATSAAIDSYGLFPIGHDAVSIFLTWVFRRHHLDSGIRSLVTLLFGYAHYLSRRLILTQSEINDLPQ
jgi:hypothetical protein